MDSSIAAVMSTSPTSGTLRMVLGASPSIAATMCLETAFFDPRTRISPRSGPDGSTCQVSVTLITVRAKLPGPGQLDGVAGTAPAARSGSITRANARGPCAAGETAPGANRARDTVTVGGSSVQAGRGR